MNYPVSIKLQEVPGYTDLFLNSYELDVDAPLNEGMGTIGAFDPRQTRLDDMKMHMFLCCLADKRSENP